MSPEPKPDRLLEILRHESFVPGRVKLASGRMSDFYIDIRKSAFLPEAAFLIGEALLPRVRALDVRAVGGLAVGAIPLVDAVVHASHHAGAPIPGFFVRKEAKEHGLGRKLEGRFESGWRVAILEDVVTSGESALGAADAVEDSGGIVAGVIALVDRLEGGAEAIRARGYPFETIYTRKDF